MQDYFISMGVAILLKAVKDPIQKRKMRHIFLKVFNSIKAAFPDDKDFQ